MALHTILKIPFKEFFSLMNLSSLPLFTSLPVSQGLHHFSISQRQVHHRFIFSFLYNDCIEAFKHPLIKSPISNLTENPEKKNLVIM